jgi:hypothetical protein
VLSDDWVTPNKTKLDIIAKAHPRPTKFPKVPILKPVPVNPALLPLVATNLLLLQVSQLQM